AGSGREPFRPCAGPSGDPCRAGGTAARECARGPAGEAAAACPAGPAGGGAAGPAEPGAEAESVRYQPSPGECRLAVLAGTPAITEWSGNSPHTTAPPATTDCRPILVPGRMIAPAPIQEPEPISTGLLRGHCRPIGTSGSS